MSGADTERVDRYRQALRAAKEEPLEHDSCGNCGDENELDWRPEEREITLAYAAMALADKEHARLTAEVEALRRVVRGSGQSRREAENRAEAAEATLANVRALHSEPYPSAGWCAGCHDGSRADEHPCETAALVDARAVTESRVEAAGGDGMSARMERFAEALTSDWHDATCPDGKDCRSRWVHSRGLSWPATLAKVIEQGAIIAVADAELAEQDQSWSLFHTDTTRALEAAEAKLAGMREETRTLADGMGGSVWSDGKLVQSFSKPNTVQRRLVTEWTGE